MLVDTGLTHLQGLIMECLEAKWGRRFWSHSQQLGATEGLLRCDVGRHGREQVHAGAVRGQGVHQRDRLAGWHAIMPLQEI